MVHQDEMPQGYVRMSDGLSDARRAEEEWQEDREQKSKRYYAIIDGMVENSRTSLMAAYLELTQDEETLICQMDNVFDSMKRLRTMLDRKMRKAK
jgi:hypothetical protein